MGFGLMDMGDSSGFGRRAFLAGSLGAAVLALPGCATTNSYSLVDAVRNLLMLSSDRAFARLIAPDGYWDNAVGQMGLASFMGSRGGILQSILTGPLFKSRLEGAFADIAEEGAYRAAPLVADAVRVIGINNAVALIHGEPTAATSFLRASMGNSLIEVMVPEVGGALRVAQEPLVGQLLAGLTGVDVSGIAGDFSAQVNNVIWREMGAEEAAIRANPRSTNDPLLIAVLTAGGAL